MNQNVIAVVSLIFLVGAIALGFVKKMNVGIIAFGAALILGRVAGLTDKKIIAGFNSSLVVMLIGVTLLFGILQLNGTLELIAKKCIALAGRQLWIIPLLMYVIGAGIAGMGPGTIPGFAIVALFGVPLARAMGADPFLLTTIGQLGAIGGGIVPIAPTGIIGLNLAAEAGIQGNVAGPLVFNTMLCTLVGSIVTYIVFKGYKLKGENPIKLTDLPKFTGQQKISLLGIVIMMFGTIVLNINVGLISFIVAIALIMMKVAKERECIKAIPWGTILLISGMGTLMNVVISVGGIDLLARTLAGFMSAKSAAPILALSSGIMSWFSSTSGVVMPTMIPTIPTITSAVGGVSGALLVSAVVCGSSPAGVSPVSTGGALVMAAMSEEEQMVSVRGTNKLFGRLFLVSMFEVFVAVIFIALGGFRIYPFY
ncbi:MAG: hypothetical protein LUK37_21755 [Clostridia bacterium]|nr:hypothetical protein [Clostridia bacterium]